MDIGTILGTKASIVGLDIGPSSTKVVEITKTPQGLQLQSAGIAANPAAEKKEIEEKGEEEISQSIKELFHKANIKGKEVATSLSATSVMFDYLQFPSALTPEELRKAVNLEAEQVISNKIENMNIDFQSLPSVSEKEEKITVLLVAAPKEITERKTRIIEKAGLNPVIMDVDTLALLNAYSESIPPKEQQKKEDIMILNIGADFTNVAILGKKGFPIVRNVSWGGSWVTKSIQKAKGISVQEAEQLKKDSSTWQEKDLDINVILNECATSLGEEITRSVEYAQDKIENLKLQKVLLTGGSSSLPHLDEFLAKELNLAAEIWNPFSKLKGIEATTISPEQGPLFSVAIGLGLRKV